MTDFRPKELTFEAPLTFQDRLVPKGARLAGWAALVHGLRIQAPVRVPSAVAKGHIKGSHRLEDGWAIYDKRYWPGKSVTDHLSFALRHEELDLLVLKRAFDAMPPEALAAFVRQAPTGTVARRAWFFFEALTGRKILTTRRPSRRSRHSIQNAISPERLSFRSDTGSGTTCSDQGATAR